MVGASVKQGKLVIGASKNGFENVKGVSPNA